MKTLSNPIINFIITFILILGISVNKSNAQAGALDPSFDGDGRATANITIYADIIQDIAIQTDGKIVAVGVAGNTTYDFFVVRYNLNGTLDNTFDTDGIVVSDFGGTHEEADVVAIQSDGKIVVGGWSDHGIGRYFALARYNTNGSLDITFDGDGTAFFHFDPFSTDHMNGLGIQPDGKIVMSGQTNVPISGLASARCNSDGSIDSTFGGDGYIVTPSFSGWDLALQSDGKIVVAGNNTGGPSTGFGLVRFNTDGSLDSTFDIDGKVITYIGSSTSQAFSVAIQSDGKIVATGTSSAHFSTARYNNDGSLDTSFDGDGIVTTIIPGTAGSARSVSIQSNGKIVVSGCTDYTVGNNDFALIRYNTNGSLDNTFDTDGMLTTDFGSNLDFCYASAIEPDGKIVLGGSRNNGGGSDEMLALSRYLDCGLVPVNLGANISQCGGSSILLNAGKLGESYLWSDASTDNTFTVTTSGIYSVAVTDVNGCIGRDTITITFNSFPIADFVISPSSVCISAAPYALTGGIPSGGIYGGTGVVANVFNPVLAGVGVHTISYIYTDVNGCSDTAQQNINVELCTGIQTSIESNGFLIYPNPSNGIFNVQYFGKSNQLVFEVYNLLGEKKYSLVSNTNSIAIDLSKEANAVYFIRVTSDTETITKRIIKQ